MARGCAAMRAGQIDRVGLWSSRPAERRLPQWRLNLAAKKRRCVTSQIGWNGPNQDEPCSIVCLASPADCAPLSLFLRPRWLRSTYPAHAQSADPKAADKKARARTAAGAARRRVHGNPASGRRPCRQSRMRLAWPPGGQSALARRPRDRLPPPRSLRPFRLPGRPRPGGVPLPDSARRAASIRRRPIASTAGSKRAGSIRPQPAPPPPAASAAAPSPTAAAISRTTAKKRRGVASNSFKILYVVLNLPCARRYLLSRRSQGGLTLLTTNVEPWGQVRARVFSPRVVELRCAPSLPCSRS